MRALIKRFLAKTPYTLMRCVSVNRFQATYAALDMLAQRGFRPPRIIDAGANTGEFTVEMRALFPDAVVHMIEPQPGCQPDLHRLRDAAAGKVELHPVALADPESAGTTLTMATDAAATSTGAHITDAANGIKVPCETLDSLMSTSSEDTGSSYAGIWVMA